MCCGLTSKPESDARTVCDRTTPRRSRASTTTGLPTAWRRSRRARRSVADVEAWFGDPRRSWSSRTAVRYWPRFDIDLSPARVLRGNRRVPSTWRVSRGRGAGRVAMEALIDAARTAGSGSSRASSWRTPRAARCCSVGFREVGTYEARLDGVCARRHRRTADSESEGERLSDDIAELRPGHTATAVRGSGAFTRGIDAGRQQCCCFTCTPGSSGLLLAVIVARTAH